MAINRLIVHREANGSPSFLRVAPGYVQTRVLAAATAETVTPPATARFVVFSADAHFWVDPHGATAAVPAADVTDGTSPELNPSGYELRGMASFSVISPTACKLSMAFYE